MIITGIALIGLLAVATALPLDQSWQLVPNSEGYLHLVNINPYNLPELDPNKPEHMFTPENDMVFRLFTRSNPTEPQILSIGNPSSITGSNFNAAHRTRFTIHGWNGNGNDGSNTVIRNSLLSVGDFNVISVDWSVAAVTPNYISARNAVGPAGTGVGLLISQLMAHAGANLNNIHVSGFSLGAHVAGNTGKRHGGNIHTIIALDPAGPLFSAGQADAVSPQDGQYVETIMTNAGVLGINVPLGQANFYPNGGSTQPGCGVDVGGGCAHGRAPTFYAESLSSSVPFRSTRCASHAEILGGVCTPSGPDANMGGEPSNHGRGVNGVYFLTTNAAAPFAQG
ncbi:pancreatic triacylglycerol lipase-like [Topomyia yanbarensis]|uniref:pancreatic triacylglycerol lipase-like n=1 Tax=Topomyia yanbarensis TaxID=2498891 RepID=UPI00273CCF04|nr:pancreatic triacylglycerol lipase-like [Topomyia yanbarensis]